MGKRACVRMRFFTHGVEREGLVGMIEEEQRFLDTYLGNTVQRAAAPPNRLDDSDASANEGSGASIDDGVGSDAETEHDAGMKEKVRDSTPNQQATPAPTTPISTSVRVKEEDVEASPLRAIFGVVDLTTDELDVGQLDDDNTSVNVSPTAPYFPNLQDGLALADARMPRVSQLGYHMQMVAQDRVGAVAACEVAAEEGEAEHEQPRTPTVSQMWGHDDDGMNTSPFAPHSSSLHNDPALVDAQMQMEEKEFEKELEQALDTVMGEDEEKQLEKEFEQVLDEALHDVQIGVALRDVEMGERFENALEQALGEDMGSEEDGAPSH